MYKKFSGVINKRDDELEAVQLAGYIREIISPIPTFGSFISARESPISAILIFLCLILIMSRYLPDPIQQTNKQ